MVKAVVTVWACLSVAMRENILFLSRPVSNALGPLHEAGRKTAAVYPVWRLLLTAMFAATAALTCAAVVILGAPGGDPSMGKGDPVQMNISAPAR